MFRKVLVILSLVFLINHTIDYQSDQYDVVRYQLEQIRENPHITQLESYVSPVYYTVYDQYYAPSAEHFKVISGDFYTTHVKEYVDLVKDTVVKSPVVQNVSPYVYQYYGLLSDHLALLNKYVNYYISYSAYEVIRFFNLNVLGLIDYDYSAKFQCIKRCSLKYYNKNVSPMIQQAYRSTISFFQCLLRHVELITKYAFAQLKLFFAEYIFPFYQSSIEPHYVKYVQSRYQAYIEPLYISYVKPVFTYTASQTEKYYKLFRLHQALDLSKDLVSNSYQQALEYFKEEEIKKSHQLEIVDKDLEIINDDNEQKSNEVILAQNLEDWKDYMDKRVYSFFSDFEAQIEEMEEAKINKYYPQITELLQNLSLTLNTDYIEITKVISEINSHTALLENGQEVELDSAGNIIDHKISRQEFRDLLKAGGDRSAYNAERVNNKLRELKSEIEMEVDEIRQIQVDTFEDFYVKAVDEYTKSIMATDYADSFQNYKDMGSDGVDMSEWRIYAKTKRNLIKKRDELASYAPALTKVDQLLASVKRTLTTFNYEQGDHYYVLRSMANVEFQTREMRESEELELIEKGEAADDEEEFVGTLTQTVVRYQTVGEDGNIINPESTPEPVEPPALSEKEESATSNEKQTEAEVISVDSPVEENTPVPQPVEVTEGSEAVVKSTESSSEETSMESEDESSSSSAKSEKVKKAKQLRPVRRSPKNQTVAVADQAASKSVNLED